jgi:hypothetical protein
MTSIENTIFMIKHDFHKTIKQYSQVKIITIINNSCLVEDINTKERLWVMSYDIYPIDNVYYGGWWQQNDYYDNLYKEIYCSK